MAVNFHYIYPVPLHFDLRKVVFCLQKIALLEGKSLGDVNIVFCDNPYIYRLNVEYLKHFYPTDVITFDYSSYPVVAGDIFIGVDVVRANAQRFSVTFQVELLRVIFHGLLHLCGYKDKTKAQRLQMRRKEDYYLKLFTDYAD